MALASITQAILREAAEQVSLLGLRLDRVSDPVDVRLSTMGVTLMGAVNKGVAAQRPRYRNTDLWGDFVGSCTDAMQLVCDVAGCHPQDWGYDRKTGEQKRMTRDAMNLLRKASRRAA